MDKNIIIYVYECVYIQGWWWWGGGGGGGRCVHFIILLYYLGLHFFLLPVEFHIMMPQFPVI